MESFGEQLKIYRKQTGINQEEFAPQVGCVDRTLRNWENNKTIPSRGAVFNMIEIFVQKQVIISTEQANIFFSSCDFKSLTQTEIDDLKLLNADFDNHEKISIDDEPNLDHSIGYKSQHNETLNREPQLEVQIVRNVWYKNHEEQHLRLRRLIKGTLFLESEQLRYEDKRGTFLILKKEHIDNVKHILLTGDLAPNWVQIAYLEDGEIELRRVWFADASGRLAGFRNLIGGSHDLFNRISNWFIG